ncbi:MAG: hypothetical protein IPK83_05065 [Planctomycetes bacterium]|nr:hypothetical protein [Planctomycetota bacterium]
MNDRQHDILKRLASVRRRVRLLLAAEGAAILFVMALACGVSFALLDWWVDFPGLIRVLVLAVGCGLGAGWCWRRVVRPLVATIPLDQLALRLGIMNPEERDELAGAVSFLDGHGSGSTKIWERVVATTSQHAAEKSWGRGLNPRRSARSVGAAVVLFGGVAWTAHVLPELAEIGRSRLLAPWVSVEWPRRVQIIPETRDVTAAFGESVTLAMHVSRGDDPFLRAYVEWGPAGGEMRKSLMQREADGTFQFAIEDVRVPLEYSYSAGDDNTKQRPFHISVARRPETDSARIAIRPPPYARGASTIMHELTGAPVSVVRGSHARVEVQVRHGDSAVREGSIRFAGSDETIALIPMAGRESELTAEFEVADGGSFEIGLIDADGLESRTRQMYELVVKEDELPAVEILSPTDDIDMTPRGVVEVSVRGRDDFGLASLLVYAGVDEDPLEPAFDLLPVEDEGRKAEPAIRETKRSIQWRLGFMEPRVAPGNVIEYAAEAGDLFELDGVRHEAVRSATRRIHIVSESQFAESLRASLSAATAQLRRLASEMRTVRSDTARLNEGPLVRRSMGNREREQASRLAREMRRIAKAGKETSRQLEEIASRADENRVSRLDVALQAKRLGRRIRSMAKESIREAGSALSRASESERFEQQGEALSKALAEEDSVLADMMEMLDSLERWNDFADMARLIRELLDRQEDLERVCARLAGAGRSSH